MQEHVDVGGADRIDDVRARCPVGLVRGERVRPGTRLDGDRQARPGQGRDHVRQESDALLPGHDLGRDRDSHTENLSGAAARRS